MRNKNIILIVVFLLCCSLASAIYYVFIPKVIITPDFIDAPFVELNVPVNLTLKVTSAENSNIVIDDLLSTSVKTDGSYINFSYSNLHYSEMLSYNSTGSKNFRTYFTRPNSTIKQFMFNLSVVEYVNLTIELYRDVNLSKHYSDNKAYIIAVPLFKTDYDFSMYRRLGNSFNKVNTFLGKQLEEGIGIDLSPFFGTPLYMYSQKVFIAPLHNGVAIVELPKGFKYNVNIFAPTTSQNFLLVGNRYKEMYYKDLSYEVNIERSLMITQATTLQAVISRAETHPLYYWSSKIIFWLLILGTIAFPIIVWKGTEDIPLATKTALTMLAITLLTGFIILVVNWIVY